MTGCVLCNGELRDETAARGVIAQCQFVAAADGGARHAAKLGVRPHVLIGDGDSLAKGHPFEGDREVEIIRRPARKDRSDTELAVNLAIERDCDQITLLAATGGRLDHTLANVAIVAAHPGRVAVLDGAATLVAVDSSEKCQFSGGVGTLVSLIPFGGPVRNVKANGLKYPLDGIDLSAGSRGLSNELAETSACLCVDGGVLLVYVGERRPVPGQPNR